jgi:hypothetical protein
MKLSVLKMYLLPYAVEKNVHRDCSTKNRRSVNAGIVCNRGGGDQVVWRASTVVINCVFDQIPNLPNCFTTPNKNLGGRGPQTDKHLPPCPFTGQFFKKSRHFMIRVYKVFDL